MSEPPGRRDDLQGRYGTAASGTSYRLKLVVALGAAALLGWLVWVAYAAATPAVRTQVLDFRVLDDRRVQASVEVVADPRATVTCTLRAQDRDHATTGLRRVVIEPGSTQRRVLRTVIETRDRAVVVTVVACRATT